jgi:hypothetical protein
MNQVSHDASESVEGLAYARRQPVERSMSPMCSRRRPAHGYPVRLSTGTASPQRGLAKTWRYVTRNLHGSAKLQGNDLVDPIKDVLAQRDVDDAQLGSSCSIVRGPMIGAVTADA